MFTDVNVTIVCLIVLTLFVLIGFIILKFVPKASDKTSAMDFLNSIYDEIVKSITETIDSASVDGFSSVIEFKKKLLENIYENVWKCVSELIAQSDIKFLSKILNKKCIENHITKILEATKCNEKIEQIWNRSFESQTTDIEKEDEKLQEEFSDPSKYIEDFDKQDLEPAEEIVPSDDELDKLNPPKEDIDTYNNDDVSVEEVEEEDDTFIDAKGRRRDKKTGRYV